MTKANNPDPAIVLIKKLKVKPADRSQAAVIEALESVKIESEAECTLLLGMMDGMKRKADRRFMWCASGIFITLFIGLWGVYGR